MKLAIALLLFSGPALAEAEETNHWREMARDDLAFVHRTLADHHPGPLNEEDPAFGRWHQQGYEESLALLDKVKSLGGYRAVLDRYVAGFRDGHLNVNLSLDYKWLSWPGFMVAWREGGFVVHHVADGIAEPPVGARLVACDGVDAETLFEQRVRQFGGKDIPADRYLRGPELFINRVNPLIEELGECVFSTGSRKQSVKLRWQWLRQAELAEIHDRAVTGRRGEFSQREIAGDGLWLSFPTFGPSGVQEALAKSIMASLPGHRDRDYVVVDLRNNGGGSSWWAEEFVRQLYGESWLKKLLSETGTGAYPTHRVSPENLEHFRALLPRLIEQAGENSRFHRSFAALVEGMERALETGEPMYDHDIDLDLSSGDSDDTISDAQPLYGGRLYLLTDSKCGSACLDFMDVALELPDAVHVGQPTSADTTYMEIRGLTLPSRNGRLNFATKVYRGRSRGHNEFYAPEHLWGGDIWDTPAVERWIVGLAVPGGGT